MLNFLKKNPNENISRVNPGFEETERRTPKAGIILLIVMFIAGISFGWRALDDLGRVPKHPEVLSSCSYGFQSAYVSGSLVEPAEPIELYREYSAKPYYYDSVDRYSKCQFSELEKKYSIPSLFDERNPIQKELTEISKQISSVENSIQQVRQQINRLTGEYGVGLQEAQGGVPAPVFPTDQSQQSLKALQTQERQLLAQKSDLEAQSTSLKASLKIVDDKIREAYKPVFKDQNVLLRWYDFWVFLLQLAFVLPFFWIVFRAYIHLHRKNSPYTVIFTAMLAVASALLLRVVLFWFWDLFLEEVLRTIWRWIQNFRILRSIVFYGGMLLSFAIFGGGVYYLQKRIFDPRRVAIRRFRAKQCPQCQTSLDISGMYCPNCGYHLREKCAA
ncbi:MAG: hypothetical protein AAB602_03445, partial [Patescibacteria group bacterium]